MDKDPDNTPQSHETIDCSGLLCPLPVLKVRKRLMSMQKGQVLSVIATDPMADIDLPHFCAEAGHHFISSRLLAPVGRIYLIQKG